MAYLDRLLSWGERQLRTFRLARALARQQKGVAERVVAGGLMGGRSAGLFGAPGGWSQRYEQVQHFRHWVYLSVRAVCEDVGGLSPVVARVRPGPAAAGRPARKSTQQPVHAHEDVEPCGPGHPLVRLFSRPNDWDTDSDLWYELILFLELTGNSYLWCCPSKAGVLDGSLRPAELMVLPSHWMKPVLGPAGVDYYECHPYLSGGGMLRFPAEEIIHVRYKSPLHKLDGWSPLQAGGEWVDLSESVDRARFWTMKNGAFPMGSVELGENYQDPDDADLERIYAKFASRYAGEANTGRPLILPPGAKYNPLQIAPTEMGFLETAEQVRDWTLALWGVPKERVGIAPAGNDLSWYAPFQQYCRFTLQPRLRLLGKVLTRHLCPRYGDPDLRVYWDDPTPDNPDQLNKDIQTDFAVGAVSVNEVRALRGREPWPGGESPLVPGTLSPLPLNETADPAVLSPPQPAPAPFGGGGAPFGKGYARKAVDLPDVRQRADFACGAAALLAVLKHYGMDTTEPALCRLLGTTPSGGTTPGSIVRAAKALGLSARAGTLTLAGLKRLTDAGTPVVCPVQQSGEGEGEGHYVVVADVDAKSVYVQDPAAGPRRVGRRLWLRRWHDTSRDGGRFVRYGVALGGPRGAARPRKGSWNESDHPRADDGKFGSGSGSSGSGGGKPARGARPRYEDVAAASRRMPLDEFRAWAGRFTDEDLSGLGRGQIVLALDRLPAGGPEKPAGKPAGKPAAAADPSAGHPLAGRTRAEQVRELGRLSSDDRPGGDDPLGLRAAGPPPGAAALEAGIVEAVRAHAARAGAGAPLDVLYGRAGGGASKFDFLRALVDLHDRREGVRLSGWPRMPDDLPDPELAPVLNGKIMFYAQARPAKGLHRVNGKAHAPAGR